MNLVFIGFKHGHTIALYNEAMAHPEINVLGAYEPTEAGRKLAESLNPNYCYDSLEAIWADPNVDAVCLGSFFAERGAHAIAALKAGKHVYADKPLCTSLEELDEIEKLAKEKNLKVGVHLSMRFSLGIRDMREMIAAGTLGKIGAVNITAQHPLMYGSRPAWYFEDGKHGGTINDIGIHGTDLVRFLTGEKLKKVHGARCWNHWATEAPCMKDSGQFMVELENGCGLTCDVSYAAPSYNLETYWRVTVWGTNGVAEYKLKSGEKQVGIDASDDSIVQVCLLGDPGFKKLENKTKYDTTPWDEFVNELKGNTDGLLIDTDDVLTTTREILTIQAAADANK